MELSNLEPLPILVFSNLVMVAFLLLLGRKSLRDPYTLRPWRRYLMILTALVFCLFSFWGTDWFHYAEMYINLVYMDGFNTSLEDVYYLIANYLSPNYLVFRAIIWGCALYLLCLICKHVSARADLIFSIFCGLWLIDFGYGRVVLAYTLMFLGGAIISKPINGKILSSLILGGFLILASAFFHKSAFFGIFLVLLAFPSKLLNKRTFVLIMMAYPFVLLLVQLLLAQFMDSAVDSSGRNTFSTAGQEYLNSDTEEMGIAKIMLTLIRNIPYYLVAWIGYKASVFKPEEEEEEPELDSDTQSESESEVVEVPADIRFFSRLLFYIVLVSTIFLFDLGANTFPLYVRFMMFGFIPACVVLAWAWQNDFCPRLVKYTYIIGLGGTCFALLYSFYISYLGVAT